LIHRVLDKLSIRFAGNSAWSEGISAANLRCGIPNRIPFSHENGTANAVPELRRAGFQFSVFSFQFSNQKSKIKNQKSKIKNRC